MTYFGSTLAEREVVTVTPVLNPCGGAPCWRIAFQDESLREPVIPDHPTLKAAFAQAALEVQQPISDAGKHTRRLHAFLITRARFPRHATMSDADLFAGCQLMAGTMDGINAFEIYSQFQRKQAAA
ncbi:MAG: hypothetical protein DI537_10180 [Stutzerimonas stutzeri]|nr:MAG: hypothetical protein DI537_10180 [Stutzerimonas stutzeri]